MVLFSASKAHISNTTAPNASAQWHPDMLCLVPVHMLLLLHIDDCRLVEASGCHALDRQVAMGSMPGYAVLPAVTEAVVELGWTRAYARIDDVGLLRHIASFAVYMACVEFGVYWMHRLLHDIRPGYK